MRTICDLCGGEIQIGDYPFCKGDPARHVPGSTGVISDDIPGGLYIKHALCHEDGTPKRYDSKSAIVAEAKRRGYVNRVEHVGKPGSDKSPHTTRWV